MRSILIDPAKRAVVPYRINGSVASLQAAVGSLIAFATQLDTGDVLYVDDEGLLRDNPSFFAIAGGRHPYAGRGLLVGPETYGAITDVVATVEEVKSLVSFDVEVDLKDLLTVRTITFNSVSDFLDYLHGDGHVAGKINE